MATPTEKPDYVSFLVRLWRDPAKAQDALGAEAGWIIQIEHIPGGRTEYFASLDQFFAFMRGRLSGPLPRDH